MSDIEASLKAVSDRLDAALLSGNEIAFDRAWIDLLRIVDERQAAEKGTRT